MRIRPAIAGGLLLAAASTIGAQGVRVRLPAWNESVLLDSLRQDTPINAAPEAVYQAVLKAYADLGIPTGNTDGKSGIIGSEKFEKMRTLAGAPMSMSFSCGESVSGPNANSFRLSIAIVTWVAPRGATGSTLGVAAAASGEDVSGVYKNPHRCGSTGRIEMKIVEAVQKLAR